MENQYVLFIFLATFFGGLFDGLMGWAKAKKAGENWEFSKYLGTILTAVASAGAFAATYAAIDRVPGAVDYILAFGTGAGIDNVTNKTVSVKSSLLGILKGLLARFSKSTG